ncbi:MAG: hypothetical protein U5M50_08995 [Sphingobium sp.]|nr:hypothetical protein [Sphingobium sp.]
MPITAIALAMMAPAPVDLALPAMPTSLDQATVIDGWVGRRRSPSWSEDVKLAYRRGQCSGAVNWEGGKLLEIDVLFLVGPGGKLMRLAPVNVGCRPVEEFVAKRIKGTLGNSFPDPGATPAWYRSQVRFLWTMP